VKSPGTRLGGAQCRRSREFPLSEALKGRVSGIRIPRTAGHALERAGDFTQRAKGISPSTKTNAFIRHFDLTAGK
jgi:hypothetical protein